MYIRYLPVGLVFVIFTLLFLTQHQATLCMRAMDTYELSHLPEFYEILGLYAVFADGEQKPRADFYGHDETLRELQSFLTTLKAPFCGRKDTKALLLMLGSVHDAVEDFLHKHGGCLWSEVQTQRPRFMDHSCELRFTDENDCTL